MLRIVKLAKVEYNIRELTSSEVSGMIRTHDVIVQIYSSIERESL